MPALILIADDDSGVRLGLVGLCRAAGWRTLEAGSGRETLEQAALERPDVVLLDLDMPEGNGLEVLPTLMSADDPPGVVILTGHADVRTAVQAMRLGADNLLEKPFGGEELQDVVERVLAGRNVREERDRLRDELAGLRSSAVVGRSRGIRAVMDQVQKVAATPRTTVLIHGESGVGKELVARAVHDNSSRAKGPFIALNCAAIAETLIEAELFGYEPGAFTGGDPKGRDGLLHAADGGTLLLDEVGELAPALQAKLLRVLQERTYRRVGGSADLPVDARILASTNRDLAVMVEERTFREDLFYRLNVLSIVVPPLRERKDDIAPIATHYLARFGEELARDFTGFSEAAMERLRAHPWPGNVRELRNTVERAAIQAEEGLVRPQHLGLDGERTGAAGGDGALPLTSSKLKDMEEVLIRRVLDTCEGNRSHAARELGINRTTLYAKLKTYAID
tara:strand:+ start:1053 stop:2408 length:1356 start_codon:yes stop_codon:yes gene_type:complete